jgi:hypothetical protein
MMHVMEFVIAAEGMREKTRRMVAKRADGAFEARS